MKKLIFMLVVLLSISTCENEPIDNGINDLESVTDLSTKKADRIAICHKNGIEITIAEAAVEAHLAHGDAVDRDGDGYYDRENPCSETDCDDENYSEINMCCNLPGIYTVSMHDSYGDGWQTDTRLAGSGIKVDIDGTIVEIGLCSDYFDGTFLNSGDCTSNDGFEGTATVTVPEGTQSVLWYFPGDWYAEISFEVYAPDGSLIYQGLQGETAPGLLQICPQ